MPEDRFEVIAEKRKLSTLAAKSNSKETIEKIFTPRSKEARKPEAPGEPHLQDTNKH